MYNIPNHIAIVPDGNRRWARKNGLKPWQGHVEGAKRTEELVKKTFELGIVYLTFWGSSEDNLKKRPLVEKKALLDIYEKYFKKLISSKDIFEKEIRINIVGRWREQFPKNLVSILTDGIEKTKDHSKYFLTFLLAYNGDDDMITAAQNIQKHAASKEKQDLITKNNFSKYLMSSMIPDVDLLIRTGVENDPHNSTGFLMWQTKSSQYYFSDKMFPDFQTDNLLKAIENFSKRARRLGA